MSACPVCGGPLVGEGMRWMKGARILVNDTSAVRFSKNEAELFDFLWQHRKNAHVYSAQQIADYVYRDDPDGGPDHAATCIRLIIYRMRARIKGLGLTVLASTGAGGGYMMGGC